jgi:hypothetical protein
MFRISRDKIIGLTLESTFQETIVILILRGDHRLCRNHRNSNFFNSIDK